MCGIKPPGEKLKLWLRPKRFDRERGFDWLHTFTTPLPFFTMCPASAELKLSKLSLQADISSLAAMDRFAEANYELLRAENAFLLVIVAFLLSELLTKEMLRDAELDIWLADVEEHINVLCIASI